ncbi:class I SAM-dependent methyltransferase [Streptomyces sp. KLOTTS4A1]|uniref:class I SAM-dependent methyltransferase n=1 Tax=Streptomyces sp. KLOTTS4A1 TaxID=3390996 RepID=UPI0039F57426
MTDTGTDIGTGTSTTGESTRTDWRAWQDSWDRQQQWYLPDREERFAVMLDMVEAFAGPKARVLDLACGTGSISDRLLRRFPEARSTGVDLDPALLTIAEGTFAGDERVTLVRADLKDPQWAAKLPYDSYDAVLTATALHWLHSPELAVLYGQIAGLVRAGGVFMNADHMPDPATPGINAAESAYRNARARRAKTEGVLDWTEWWQLAAADPVLAEPTAERFAIYGEHADGDMPSAEWHASALREQGFAEARTVWASPADALVLALK